MYVWIGVASVMVGVVRLSDGAGMGWSEVRCEFFVKSDVVSYQNMKFVPCFNWETEARDQMFTIHQFHAKSD